MKTLLLITLFCFYSVYSIAGSIKSYSNSEIIAIGASNLENKLLAEKQAIEDALSSIQEFLDGVNFNTNSIHEEGIENGAYFQKYKSHIRKSFRGSTRLKYKLIDSWVNTEGTFKVKILISKKIIEQSNEFKNNIKLSEYGLREIICNKLSYQSCEYLKNTFQKQYSSSINKESPFYIEIKTSSEVHPSNSCDIENLGGTLIFNSICFGSINIHGSIILREDLHKPFVAKKFNVVCNRINLSEITIYNGFPTIFEEKTSIRCGNSFFDSAISTIDLIMKTL